jgi:hypothetical protein
MGFLEFWAEHISGMNGKPWNMGVAVAPVLRICSDASESGYGAHMPSSGWQLACSFSEEEQHRMDENSFSSTEREVRGFLAALVAVHRSDLGTLAGKRVQIWSDGSAAVHDCTRMRGTATIFRAVRELYKLAFQLQIQMEFLWVPRSHPDLVLADRLPVRIGHFPVQLLVSKYSLSQDLGTPI